MADHPYLTLLDALILAIPGILAWAQGIRNGRTTTVVSGKVDEVSVKADQIHDLTNSALTTVKADLALALDRIRQLESLVNTLQSALKEVR